MTESRAEPSPPAGAHPSRRLVIFDLDGTLTQRDTFVPYVLRFCRKRPWLYLRLPALLPTAIAFALGRVDRGHVKAALIRAVLGGRTHAQIEAWTARYVPYVLDKQMRAEALAVLAQHRQSGDRLVLLSASPDLYVPALAARLGFDETHCTGVRWVDNLLDGALTTPNRRGEEKSNCLKALRQGHPGLTLVAYANSESDLEHLLLADEKKLVNAPPRLRREAQRLGIPTGDWH